MALRAARSCARRGRAATRRTAMMRARPCVRAHRRVPRRSLGERRVRLGDEDPDGAYQAREGEDEEVKIQHLTIGAAAAASMNARPVARALQLITFTMKSASVCRMPGSQCTLAFQIEIACASNATASIRRYRRDASRGSPRPASPPAAALRCAHDSEFPVSLGRLGARGENGAGRQRARAGWRCRTRSAHGRLSTPLLSAAARPRPTRQCRLIATSRCDNPSAVSLRARRRPRAAPSLASRALAARAPRSGGRGPRRDAGRSGRRRRLPPRAAPCRACRSAGERRGPTDRRRRGARAEPGAGAVGTRRHAARRRPRVPREVRAAGNYGAAGPQAARAGRRGGGRRSARAGPARPARTAATAEDGALWTRHAPRAGARAILQRVPARRDDAQDHRGAHRARGVHRHRLRLEVR